MANARQFDMAAVRSWRRAPPDGEHQRFIRAHTRQQAHRAQAAQRHGATANVALIDHQPALPEHDDLFALIVEADKSLQPRWRAVQENRLVLGVGNDVVRGQPLVHRRPLALEPYAQALRTAGTFGR